MSMSLFVSAQRIIAQVLEFLQSGAQDKTANLITDVFGFGIDNSTSAGEGFTLIPGSSSLSVTVQGQGIAYAPTSARIFISSSDTTLYNPANLTQTTNDGLGNLIPTPQSSGCVNIPLTGSVPNYLWIDYLATIDASQFTLNSETEAKIFFAQTDGYNIQVTTTNIAPDANSIFLGTINLTSISSGIIPSSAISQMGRTYFTVNPNLVPITTPFNNGSNRTPAYAQDTTYTLDAHIKSIGTGTGISPTNPHNMSLADLGVSVLDTVQEHRILEHGNGIIAGTPGNPYPSTSAMATSINVVNPGSDYITVEQLLSSEFAIINGTAFNVNAIFGAIPTNAQIRFPTTPGSSGTYNVYWDSIALSFGTTTSDISTDNTKLWIATVTWTLTGAFVITSVSAPNILFVNSTTGMNIGDTIVQGSATTTISSVDSGTQIHVGTTTGFTAGNALDTNLHNSLSSLTDRRRVGSTTHLLQRWTNNSRPGDGTLQPESGEFGFNLTSGLLEYWNGTTWVQSVSTTAVDGVTIDLNGSNKLQVITNSGTALTGGSSGGGELSVVTDGATIGINGSNQLHTLASALNFVSSGSSGIGDLANSITMASITTTGGPVLLLASAQIGLTNGPGTGQIDFAVTRNGTGITGNSASHFYSPDTIVWWGLGTIVCIDAPSAGTYTYKFTFSLLGNAESPTIENYSLQAIELKA